MKAIQINNQTVHNEETEEILLLDDSGNLIWGYETQKKGYADYRGLDPKVANHVRSIVGPHIEYPDLD